MIKRSLKQARLLLAITVIAAALSSLSLSLIPLTSGIEDGKNNIVAYAIAAVFWIGLILTLVAALLTKRKLYAYREKLLIKGFIKEQRLPGIISFSFSWKNIILYTITVLGLILIISDIIFVYVPEMIMFPIISVTILSFAVHCVVDGKYYKGYKLIKESVRNETNH